MVLSTKNNTQSSLIATSQNTDTTSQSQVLTTAQQTSSSSVSNSESLSQEQAVISLVDTLDNRSLSIYRTLTSHFDDTQKQAVNDELGKQATLFVANQVAANFIGQANAPEFSKILEKVQERGVNMKNVDMSSFLTSTVNSLQAELSTGKTTPGMYQFFNQFQTTYAQGYSPLDVTI